MTDTLGLYTEKRTIISGTRTEVVPLPLRSRIAFSTSVRPG